MLKQFEVDPKTGEVIEEAEIVEGEVEEMVPLAELSFQAQAEKRFNELAAIVRRSNIDRIRAAMLLQEAFDRQDWVLLGMPGFGAYCEAIGVPASSGSKMLKVSQTFGEKIPDLPPADIAELSVERMYVASALVESQGVDSALADAVAHPTEWLKSKVDGTDPSLAHPVKCPTCGKVHLCQPPAESEPA